MVGTRHCCWGECKTDSRYPEKWPESLKELEKSGQKVFIPFPKPVCSYPGGVLPYMGYIGMCRCEGYGFQAVYSRIGYINQSVWL